MIVGKTLTLCQVTLAVMLLNCICASVLAQDEAKPEKNEARAENTLTASLLPTLVEPNVDRWYRVLPSMTPPLLPPVTQVSYGQPFNLLIFFRDFSLDEQRMASIQYDLVIFAPSGRVHDKLDQVPAFNAKVTTNLRLALSQRVPTISFDRGDEPGSYMIEVRCTDKTNGKTATARARILLDRFNFDKDIDTPLKFRNFSEFYYANPRPNALIHSYLTQAPISPDNSERKAALEILWFYRVILAQNKWQLPMLEAAWEEANAEERRKLLVLYSAIGERPPPLGRRYSEELQEFADKMASQSLPEPYGPPQDIRQIGMLWAEFYALGKIKPIQRIVALMEHSIPAAEQEKWRSGALPHTAELQKRMLPALIADAAYNSLNKHCREHKLVRQYCEYIAVREKPENITAQKRLIELLASLPESLDATLKIESGNLGN